MGSSVDNGPEGKPHIERTDGADPAAVRACVEITRSLPDQFTSRAYAMIRKDVPKQAIYFAVGPLPSRPVGFASLRRNNKAVFEITWLGVVPAWQGKGIGRALVEAASKEARENGCKFILVRTLGACTGRDTYIGTRAFFDRLGFVHIDTIDPYPDWDPGNPCALYIKRP